MHKFIETLSKNLGLKFEESSTSIGFGNSYYCYDEGNVERIELYQSGLKKLEALLPVVEHLKVLKMTESTLDSIDSIYMFAQLEELDVHLESVTSLIGIERLKNLKRLRISCEEVSSFKEIETIDSLIELKLYCPYPPPSSIDLNKMGSLETLQLSGIESIDMVHGIEKVKHLELKNNDISEVLELEKCPNLEFLSLFSNPLTKIQGVGQLKYLKHLDLSSTQITKIENLENLESLETLSLAHNSIPRIEGLESLINLKELNLSNSLGESNTPIEEIQCLDHLSKLETLILTGHKLTELKNVPTKNLRSLDVAWNKIEYIDYNWLRSIGQPCTINITGNPVEVVFEEIRDHITIIDKKND